VGALMVPQRAVMELQGGYRVGVVGADGRAELRSVTPGAQIDGMWVIEEGVKPGESVIVTGLQYVRAGTVVKAKPAPPETGASPGAR
jgi:membrane fusion protein (multidrug efflux system)